MQNIYTKSESRKKKYDFFLKSQQVNRSTGQRVFGESEGSVSGLFWVCEKNTPI